MERINVTTNSIEFLVVAVLSITTATRAAAMATVMVLIRWIIFGLAFRKRYTGNQSFENMLCGQIHKSYEQINFAKKGHMIHRVYRYVWAYSFSDSRVTLTGISVGEI
jgi:hypothetical protein